MIFQEYGTEHKETIILLHGGGLSWWNYRDAAEVLQDEYHVTFRFWTGTQEVTDHLPRLKKMHPRSSTLSTRILADWFC